MYKVDSRNKPNISYTNKNENQYESNGIEYGQSNQMQSNQMQSSPYPGYEEVNKSQWLQLPISLYTKFNKTNGQHIGGMFIVGKDLEKRLLFFQDDLKKPNPFKTTISVDNISQLWVKSKPQNTSNATYNVSDASYNMPQNTPYNTPYNMSQNMPQNTPYNMPQNGADTSTMISEIKALARIVRTLADRIYVLENPLNENSEIKKIDDELTLAKNKINILESDFEKLAKHVNSITDSINSM
jgi:hypothetical protein